MDELAQDIHRVAAETGFSGVVRIDRADVTELSAAYGLANRGEQLPNRTGTRFATASATKGLTALVVMSLVEDGALSLDTSARAVLGSDLPLIEDDVTVEHLLSHRSGIGDYFDEDAGGEVNDYVLAVPVHQLAETEDYLAVLDGYPTKFPAGERFSYCNGGFVVLALIAERVGCRPFRQLVAQRVCEPAGMSDTEFLRSDELPGGSALGYLENEGPRTNVFHLPVRGTGDGGVYTTAPDVRALWSALFAGRIVPEPTVASMTAPRSRSAEDGMTYGFGFWLRPDRGQVLLVGSDAGVSFRSAHDPTRDLTCTVISNTSEGAWPVARRLDELVAQRQAMTGQ